MMTWLVDKLIAYAKRTPYTHLRNPDDTAYMERYWLVPYEFERVLSFWRHPLGRMLQRLGIAVRLHHIQSPDRDRVLHDHPWAFVSVVLRGWYIEERSSRIQPNFHGNENELTHVSSRLPLSIGLRWWTARHRISRVSPGGVWTLFITGPMMQWWGFYTPTGKVYYRDYESAHTIGEKK